MSAEDDHTLLVRLDERTQVLSESMIRLERTIEHRCVTKAEFSPVRNLCFALVGIVLSAVGLSLVGVVLIPW